MTLNLSPLRPPAVPLVVCDPYLSVWSMSDALTDSWSEHWTGKDQSLCGIIRIDGVAYRFMGAQPRYFGSELPPMPQTALTVLPTRTLYTFEAAGVRLQLTFTTPLLPNDLAVMSRPVTYLDFQVTSMDGEIHQVALYVDVGASWTVNTPDQSVVWGRHQRDNLDLLWIGSQAQPVLAKTGDDLRIDWGYLYVTAFLDQNAISAIGRDTVLRRHFADTGTLVTRDELEMPFVVGERPPTLVAACAFVLDEVTAEPVARQMLIAYDDQFSVEYMHKRLRPYWRRDGNGIGPLIDAALREYPALRQCCQDFDDELMADLRQVGGEHYAWLAALAFRQCIAAHKLVVDEEDRPLFFPKKILATVAWGRSMSPTHRRPSSYSLTRTCWRRN